MNYKWLSVILGLICIVLGINYYRLQNFTGNLPKVNCPDLKELEELRFQKAAWTDRENVFLQQNAELVNQVNELKMQINRKPLIIYKNVQKIKVNDVASQSYTDALQQRYSPNH